MFTFHRLEVTSSAFGKDYLQSKVQAGETDDVRTGSCKTIEKDCLCCHCLSLLTTAAPIASVDVIIVARADP